MRPLLPTTLRALARLLMYPDATLRPQLAELANALDADPCLPAGNRQALSELVGELQAVAPLVAESTYVELFDRNASTSLHLFEHVHGASHDRGPAMIDLMRTYEQTGLRLEPGELPDHLGVVLEFASTLSAENGRAFLRELTPILSGLHATLQQRGSRYAAVPAAVVALAGDQLQAKPARTEAPLDASWSEPAAFDGCELRQRPSVQPIQIVPRQAPQHSKEQNL